MDALLQDLRIGLRQLRKAPAVTALAILALALGIGATTAIFSVLDAVILRPLPFARADELVAFTESPKGESFAAIADGNYLAYAEGQTSFSGLAVYQTIAANLQLPQGPEQAGVAQVTASFFPLLGVRPALGRGFSPAEDLEGGRVALLSDAQWRLWFNADPGAVGRSVVVSGVPHTIVGVLPAGFRFFELQGRPAPKLFIPFGFTARDRENHGGHRLRGLGRLKPGVSREGAEVDLNRIAHRLGEQFPQEMKNWEVHVTPLHEAVVGRVRGALHLLLGAVGLVMLIACANVAGMLLARGAARHRELCIRASLGASRGRLVRQLLTESVVLALAAGALGLLLAAWGVDGLVALAPRDLPRLGDVTLDPRVLAFGALASIASGLLAGVAPALQLSQVTLHDALKETGSHATASGRRGRLRSALVVAEIALALMLVVGAGLLLRSFHRVIDTPLGFEPSGVLSASASRDPSGPGHDADDGRFAEAAVERLSHLPGVRSAAAVAFSPLSRNLALLALQLEGRPPPAPGERADTAEANQITSGYFETLRIPVTRGRTLADHGAMEAVVNEEFVKTYFAGREPLGLHLQLLGDTHVFTLVGVVADVHSRGPDVTPGPAVYLGAEVFPWNGEVHLMLRTDGAPLSFSNAVRHEVQSFAPAQPVGGFHLLDQDLADSVAQRRFQMLLVAAFAVLAFVLAAVGIYGVTSYSVAQRTHEIGIRAALGAAPGQLLFMVLRQGLRLAGLGLVLGLVAAAAGSRALGALLYGVSAADPLTYALVAAALGAVTVAASFVPAWRATRVSPGIALRAE